ncbi:hypothetical protein J1614_006167 [Plenodomus biglobosus]|nr:hypothetical protein J1614_006167 [Plenodomus biglobosus]
MSLSDGEDVSPAKRAYSTMSSSRNGSPRHSLKSLYSIGLGSLESIPQLPTRAHHLSPPPASGSEAGRVQLSPLSSSDLNGAVRPAIISQSPKHAGFTAVNTAAFTAVNTATHVHEPSRDTQRAASKEPQQTSPVNRHRIPHSYTSPYEPASRIAITAPHLESRSAPPMNTAPPPAHGLQSAISAQASNAPNGTSLRESPNMQHAQHAYVATQPQPTPPLPSHAPQQVHSIIHPHSSPYGHAPAQPHIQAQAQAPSRPLSRANSPAQAGGRALAPHPSSRSSTPLAQAANNQPSMAPNASAPPTSTIQHAPQYGVQLVPTQEPHREAAPRDHRALPVQSLHHASQYQHPHQPVLKSQAPEHAQSVQTSQVMHRPVVPSLDIRLLQCEVTAGLFTFFYPRSTAPPDEPSLLQRLHTLWYHGETIFRAELGRHFDLISKVLTAWLHERQAITALRHSLASQPGVSHIGLVDRLLAMNDLRVMRLKWKNMSTVDGLSPEDLLCQAFRVMTNTEGSEYLFKDGLERLNGGVFEFLRSEDAKIIMQRR